MRILMISDFYHPVLGGVEKHVRSLSQGLAQRGHQVSVVTLGRDALPETELDQGVRVHRIRGAAQRMERLFSHADRPWAPPLPDPELVYGLRKVVRQERPDVVHGHDWLARSFLPLRRASRARFVVTLHYYTSSCAKKSLMHAGGPCGGPAPMKCLRCATEHYGAVKALPTLLGNLAMSRVEQRAVDTFLAVSQATADGNQLGDGRWPMQVIPNFIPSSALTDTSDVSAYVAQLPPDGYLLFVGDLRRDKGLYVLLEAYAGLTQAPPLVLIGKPWPDTPTELPPNVTLLQNWPNYAVMEAWRRSSLALAPSIWPEPCATVVLEAMASGSPVIATRIGGNPDMVVDGETGLLVPEGDVRALRESMQRLLSDEPLRRRMAAAARRRALLFQSDTVIPRIERVYEDLVMLSRHASAATPLSPSLRC
jgi:glycosyltransferase involved in cell wall biosynthesis